jgi:hypothetical protein
VLGYAMVVNIFICPGLVLCNNSNQFFSHCSIICDIFCDCHAFRFVYLRSSHEHRDTCSARLLFVPKCEYAPFLKQYPIFKYKVSFCIQMLIYSSTGSQANKANRQCKILKHILRAFMLRRTKALLIKSGILELPPLTELTVSV